MVKNFQDDDREEAMIALFDLYKDETEGRSGIDAFLKLDGKTIPFELKTTSQGSVTTVRDFGPDYILKWKNKHWLIGFFLKDKKYYKYGSPSMMEKWIKSKEEYIAPDFKLAKLVPAKINLEDMYQIIGKKDVYTYDDAKAIQKMQYKKEQYLKLQDLEHGYSSKRMLEIIKDRAEYLIERGSTLNNPHIPFTYFDGWEEITQNHVERLRVMVREYFKEQK
ncbi:MAG: hypothetical protein HFP77_04150 [Methylococcales symbiont of Iophon sp. n. MRB-2018]|nr:MAG: hypothetical protein HFP77_04150 [Methylococcales symbiont of Iophon sp. n. MRB-2018]